MKSVTTVNMVTLGMLGLAVLIAVGLFFKPASAVLASGPESGTSAQSARVTKSDIATRIASAVEAGKLTQAEADLKLEQLANGEFSKLRASKDRVTKSDIATRIASAVEAGKLTQAEADLKLEQLANGEFSKLRAGKKPIR